MFQQVFGLRDVENNLPLTNDTRFPMASVTKSFTAMSVALLVDEGKLEWDKPVREYLPEFILDDPYATLHATVKDMLSHRTGLPWHNIATWRLDIPRTEFIKTLKHLKFNATFREKYQYNNLMYYIIPCLVEQITGQRWEDFMQERIFTPLGMTASNFCPEPPQPGQILTNGYRIERDGDGTFKELVRAALGAYTELSPGAAAGLFSALSDLIPWLKVHVNQGKVGDLQLVSPSNLKQMHLPHTIVPAGGLNEALTDNTIFTYGMGWFIEPYRGYTLVHHGGNVETASLTIGFVPQEKVGVIVLTNIAWMPFPNVLLYESIDRALNLPHKDWITKFHEVYDPNILAKAKRNHSTASEKIENAPPTHSLAAYTGTFEAKGFPDFAIRMEGSELQACIVRGSGWSTLRHFHFDIFEWNLKDSNNWLKVRFLTNDHGEIASISIPFEPTVENVLFKRKPMEIPDEAKNALLGE